MPHTLNGCFLGLAMLALAGSAPVHAQATAYTQRSTQLFTLDSVNPCTNEPVTLSGLVLTTVHSTIDNTGGFHSTLTVVPRHVVGQGASGATYAAVGGEHGHVNENAGAAPVTFTLSSTFNLVSHGAGENYTAFTLTHVTINENGIATAVTSMSHVECRG
jgi:hypothetical protein